MMGSPFELLYQHAQEVFADSAVEAKCPVPEGHFTADIE